MNKTTSHRDKDWAWDSDFELTNEIAMVAVLMDIREELETLNRVMRCPNTTRIPQMLEAIERNTRKHGKVKP